MVATNGHSIQGSSHSSGKKPYNGFDFLTQLDFIKARGCDCGNCANAPSALGSISTHCPFPERHKNGDANPSLVVWTDTGLDRRGNPITDGRANMECKGCDARPIQIIDRVRKELGRSPIDAG